MPKLKDSKLSTKLPLSKETVSDSDDLESVASAASSGAQTDSDQVSEEEEQSESGSEDDSESELPEKQIQAELEEAERRVTHNFSRHTANQSSTEEFSSNGLRPATQFVPPPGFTRIRDLSDHVSIAHDFSENNLQGKEVWHFSVPAGLSLEDLQQASLGGIQRGEPAFERQGVQYGLAPLDIAESDGVKIMVPSKSGYKTISAKINKTLRVQRVATVPNSFPTPDLPPRPRPIQPAGLRMRYKPAGFVGEDPGALGDSDPEGLNSSGFQVPPSITDILDSPSPKKRRINADGQKDTHKKSKSDEKKKEKHKERHKDKDEKQKDKHKHKHRDKEKSHKEKDKKKKRHKSSESI